ncbi:MAG: hypothetical protein WAV09_01185 [Minisyncoccia bacterium]
MQTELIVIVASIFAFIGNVPYLLDVLKKKVQPHPYTWFVWTLVSAIVFFGQVAKGAGIGAIPTFVAEIFTLIIFLFSLKYGFRNISKIDTYFFIVALLGIIPWILTKDPTISVVVAVSIDLIAFVPTLRKTWLYPSTETPLLYSMNVSRHVLTLFSLQTYNIATTVHSIAMIITNTLMVCFLLRKKVKKVPNL